MALETQANLVLCLEYADSVSRYLRRDFKMRPILLYIACKETYCFKSVITTAVIAIGT